MVARSHRPQLVTVFGGSGFAGRHTVQALARRGYAVRVAVRRPDLAGHLQPLGNIGQIHPVQANLRYPRSITSAAQGASHVINLAGVLQEKGKQTFEAVHDKGARIIAEAARDAGATLTHVSAIGASADSNSSYAQSKAMGEKAVLETLPQARIIRPSILFGPEDEFFNRFADLARFSPFLPLIGGGQTRFQPLYVGDLAEAIALSLEGAMKPNTIYELGGPEILTFRQCLETMLECIGRRRILINLPWWTARLLAAATSWIPGQPLTSDQVRLLENDNVVSQQSDRDGFTLSGLGITPHTLDVILPTYLWRFRPQGQFTHNKIA